MKKRLISLLLALTVLCTGVMLTACGGNETVPPETVVEKSVADVINEALKKTEDLDSMSAVLQMEMNMATEGITMSVPITAKIKTKDMKSDDPVASVVVTMSMFGEEMDIEMYQEGQWAYMVMGDVKYKGNAKDMEGELDYADSAYNMLEEIPDELLKDVALVKAEDGSQSATITIPAEKFADIYDDLIESVNSETDLDLGEVKISDAVVKITIANGYVTVCDIAFSIETIVEELSSTTEVKTTLTYENPGQEVTITPPEGYQDFEEMDMDDIDIGDEDMDDIDFGDLDLEDIEF